MLKEKVCRSCNKSKPIKDFWTGTGVTSSYCKICANKKAYKTGLLKNYNLTLQGYNVLFTKQKGCCAICGKHQSEISYKLYVDHNHKTSKVRGLLCSSCNTFVGYIEKNNINKVARYLKEEFRFSHRKKR